MTSFVIFQLILATALPPLASVVLLRTDQQFAFSRRNYWLC